jgi:hypothetical protein
MVTKFKTSFEVRDEILRLINLNVEVYDKRIYKRGGRRFIRVDEKLGELFCQKTNKIQRLLFVNSVCANGANGGVIFLN